MGFNKRKQKTLKLSLLLIHKEEGFDRSRIKYRDGQELHSKFYGFLGWGKVFSTSTVVTCTEQGNGHCSSDLGSSFEQHCFLLHSTLYCRADLGPRASPHWIPTRMLVVRKWHVFRKGGPNAKSCFETAKYSI